MAVGDCYRLPNLHVAKEKQHWRPRDLGLPSPTLREQAVAGLLLSSPAPSALVVTRLAGLVFQVWADSSVS